MAPRIPAQTFSVLRAADVLGSFTMPELAIAAHVSYETVKKVLREGDGAWVARTGDTASSSVGRPPGVWKVINSKELRGRLKAEPTGGLEPNRAEDLWSDDAGRLALAEDQLVFALRSSSPQDARMFADQALAQLSELQCDWKGGADPPASAGAPLAPSQNLPLVVARARAVSAFASYLRSNECAGMVGPLWRAAFSAIATFAGTEHDSLYKTFLVELVLVADRRAVSQPFATEALAASTERVSDVLASQSASDLESAIAQLRVADRSELAPIRRALTAFLTDLADGTFDATSEQLGRLFGLVRVAYAPAGLPSADELAAAIAPLRSLSLAANPVRAQAARAVLADLRQPNEQSFWLELPSHAQSPPTEAEHLGLLLRIDPELSFQLLRSELDGGSDAMHLAQLLRLGFEALNDFERTSAREPLTVFLASLSEPRERNAFAATLVPVLDWTKESLGDVLAGQFFQDLHSWQALAAAQVRSSDVAEKRAELIERIADLAVQVFPHLAPPDEKLAYDQLAAALDTPEGAALAVRVFMSTKRTAALAERLLEAGASADGPLWASAVDWYLTVCPRQALSTSDRIELINAVRHALRPGDASSFLEDLARRARHVDNEVAEITDNDDLDFDQKARLELILIGDRDANARELEERVAGVDPVLMAV